MPEEQSVYNQSSFIGGMNLSIDDSRLGPNQYRIGFNVTNRFDRLDPLLSSREDVNVPVGIKQKMTTFGNYQIIFVSGYAYYKLYSDLAWVKIDGFQMDENAPRYWTEAVPVATTNYLRLASTSTISGHDFADVKGAVNLNNVAGASAGNLPGLVVQDNINQPQFIFLNGDGIPTCRITQTFAQWSVQFTDGDNTIIGPKGGAFDSSYDKREYVPIGNAMAYVDGVLYIASQNGQFILRSVSGRPLDFVVNVTNLITPDPFLQKGGGDAYTTAYSVGVGPITCLRAMSNNALFVAAGNANFSVQKNMTQNALTMFGEYTFIRTFLFNAVCLTDRGIMDSIGDTRFISLTGVRSFNAIAQEKNEGRNSAFTSQIQGAFVKGKGVGFTLTLVQDPNNSAAILFDEYELYAVNTIFGPAIAIYDTLNQCWVGFSVSQVNGKRIKEFAKIDLTVQALYAITEDDKLYHLFSGPEADTASFRTVGVCSSEQFAGQTIKLANPMMEVKLAKTRVIVNNITEDAVFKFTPYVNNRMSSTGTSEKSVTYKENTQTPTTGLLALSDVDTMLKNLLFSTPNCEQGWKVFGLFEWNVGSITQFSMELNNYGPINPLNSQ